MPAPMPADISAAPANSFRRFAKPAAAVLTLALACCSPAPAPQPTPAPPQRPATAPPPPPIAVQLPTPENWMDAARTPGDWAYRGGASRSGAYYGEPGQGAVFAMLCDRPTRQVILSRAGQATGPVPVRILTETAERMVTAQPAAGATPTIEVTLPAGDRLLDAMALSKGRFAIGAAGLPTLYLPSWPEVTRVIEDCR
ncbi:hypothetical protein [Alteripontixanthobacter muriae]|uniref:hypothetical protein n=1 Tax=Alteripontixanthobacter muriae TaxID=2705546 RepID=UPI0019D5CC70|nr:hypothetical protein [Alteripontixanthobacter muriae]